MPLPKFTVTGNLYDVLGNITGGNLATIPTSAKVVFTPNIKGGWVKWDGDLHRILPVTAEVTADGIKYDDEPVTLLANDPGLSVENIKWEVLVKLNSIPGVAVPRDSVPKPFPIEAPTDGGTVDLGVVAPVAWSAATPIIQGPKGDSVDDVQLDGTQLVFGVNGTEIGRPDLGPLLDETVADKVDITNPLFNATAIRGAASVAFLGDSLTALNANVGTDSYSENFTTLAAFLTDGRFVFAGNFGVPSNTVQQIAARIGDVIAAKPAHCLVLAGSNSTTKGITHFDDARAVYETGIIQPLLAAGIQPTLCTIPPRDFTRQWATNTDINQGPGIYLLTLAWNVFVRAMAAKYRLPLCDMYAAVTDPSTGNYKDGYTEDGVHWVGPGIFAAAQAAADALVTPTVPSVSLERDRYSVINFCSSPLFLSGLGSGLGGLYPPGWNGPSTGVAVSIVDPVEGDGLEAGKWLRLAKTGATSVNVNMIRTLAAMATNGVTVNTGDRIALGFRYKFDAPIYDPNTYVSLSLVFRDGSAATLKQATPISQVKHSHGGAIWWETTVPSGTVDVRFNAQFSAYGDATLDLGQMSIYDLTAIGSPSFRETDLPIPVSSLTIPANPSTPVPQQPTIAAGTATATTIPYTITPGAGGATTWEVQYCLPQNLGTWTNGGSGLTGTITGLTNNQKYWVRARGVNSGGAGPWSPYIQATTALADSPPAQVTGLTAGTSTLTTQPLSWTATALTTGYIVQYKLTADSTWTTFSTPTTTSATVTGLTPGASYDYRVAATNNAGTGTYSATVTNSTQASPTVLASDSFDRANTTAGTLGTLDNAAGGSFSGSWLVTGQMQVLSNQVSAASISTPRWASVDLGVTDGYSEIEIVSGDGGVVGRYTDATSYYQFRYSNTSGWGTMNALVLEKRSSGTTTTLWTSAAGVFTPGAGQKLGLSCQGSTITPFVNGVAQTPVTDTTITTGTRWGFRSASPGTAFALDNWKAQNYAS